MVLAPPAPPIDPNAGGGAVTISDDADASVTRIGAWTYSTVTGGYWGQGYHYPARGDAAARNEWPAPAGYQAVYARWTSASNRATDAPYTITHAGGPAVRRVNQEIGGGQWNLLGIYAFDPAAGHKVVLSGDANGYVVADAIRYVQQPSPPPGAIIVDNDDPETSTAGAWVTTSGPGAGDFWGPDWRHSAAGTGADSFTWTPTIPTAGRYHVYARWLAYPNRATDAPYTIHHQTGATTVRVNQELDGSRWNLLGTYEMVPGSGHRVVLSDDANEYVTADAVMFVPDTTSRVVAADAIRLVANTAEDPLFVHADHLGTPRRMTDGARTVVWDHLTRPFGETYSLLGVFENNRRFPGQYFDSETELHYNYFRDYDPALGRYVQSDPIGLRGGLNTYGYVSGNPEKFSDKYGLSGPYHPPLGVSLRCHPDDTCPQLRGKMHVINRMIQSHQGWDRHVPPPRGGGRHALEIAELWRAYARCQAIYEGKCCDQKTEFSPSRVPVPSPVPRGIRNGPSLPYTPGTGIGGRGTGGAGITPYLR
jgi:RHS repeat-associated protein